MSVRPIILAFAAASAAFTATSVAIVPAHARQSVAVSHADLNLASVAGRRALDARLAAAVEQVCADGALDVRSIAMGRACRADAGAAATERRNNLVAGYRRGIVSVSPGAD